MNMKYAKPVHVFLGRGEVYVFNQHLHQWMWHMVSFEQRAVGFDFIVYLLLKQLLY